MVWIILFCFMLTQTQAAKYHQDDYTVKLDRIELVKCNKTYFEDSVIALVYYNRTYRGFNASGHLRKDIVDLKYHQDDYAMEMDRMELARCNKTYFEDAAIALVYYNRTYRGFNASGHLCKDIVDLKIKLQCYMFRSNEYRFFPLSMEINGCSELARDGFGIRASLEKSVNFPLRCPFKRGFMKTSYGRVNFSEFPPFIPSGQYKVNVKVYNRLDFLLEVNAYSKVEQILRIWER